MILAHRDSPAPKEGESAGEGDYDKDQNDPYIGNITVKLNTTFNNMVIFCRTYNSTEVVTSNNVSVIIQGQLLLP